MFRHKSGLRSFKDNLRLAAFLSFTAGLVNISGVLALGILTTNVTGHFAYFSEAVQKRDIFYAIRFLFYIVSFLLGSFTSSFITEHNILKGKGATYNASVFIEIGLLFFVGLRGEHALEAGYEQAMIACFLLFAMGMQNSLVTSVSNASVRTTHLTGLFTDLGIELSQLFFYKKPEQRTKLFRSVGLRLMIIAFFFLGCFIGSYIYQRVGLKTLWVACCILVFALLWDKLRLGAYRIYRKVRTT